MGTGTEQDDSKWRVRLQVKGRVQGVFYRASALTEAQRIGLQGSVQNLSDGSVEVIAGGTRAQVEEMTAWCRRGPPLASVSDVVEVEPLQPCHEELPPFQIKRSGRSDMNDRPKQFEQSESYTTEYDIRRCRPF